MILRRSILAATPTLFLPKKSWAWLDLSGGNTPQSFTQDGTRISSIGPTINSRWGQWALGPTFTGGPIFYITLNGRPATQIVTVQGQPIGNSQWGEAPSTYYLQIDHGGNIYAYPNGDTGWCSYQGYNWLPNNVTAPNAPCTPTGTGLGNTPCPILGSFSFPNYNPPYTPSADGTSITAPSGTVKNVDGVWGWGAANSFYGGYTPTLNGLGIGDDRGGGNTDNTNSLLGATAMKIANHGQLYMLLPDSTWRCLAGLQGNPVPGGDPGSGSLAVPVNITFTVTPGGTYPTFPAVPYTSGAGVSVATLSMNLSDGTVVTPATGEISIGDSQNSLSYTSSGGLVTTAITRTQGLAIGVVLKATRNGTTFSLAFTVYYY
jgi:hypothetical protein